MSTYTWPPTETAGNLLVKKGIYSVKDQNK